MRIHYVRTRADQPCPVTGFWRRHGTKSPARIILRGDSFPPDPGGGDWEMIKEFE